MSSQSEGRDVEVGETCRRGASQQGHFTHFKVRYIGIISIYLWSTESPGNLENLWNSILPAWAKRVSDLTHLLVSGRVVNVTRLQIGLDPAKQT
jgi:hypothetical protein